MLSMNVEMMPRINLIGFVSYKTPWLHFRRNTDEYVLYVIKSGELHVAENGVKHVLKKGDMLLLEPNLEHWGTEKRTCDYYYVHFRHPDLIRVQAEDLPAFAKRFVMEERAKESGDDIRCCFPKAYTLPDKVSFQQVTHALHELVQLYGRKRLAGGLTALRFTELLIELSRIRMMDILRNGQSRNTKSLMKVHDLLEYIDRHYMDKIESRGIESAFECNYDYLNRVFKEVTGVTIARYVNEVRIRHAKELIEATHLSFQEIAWLTGLGNPYYFSRTFKRHVGLSPKQYYRKVREGFSVRPSPDGIMGNKPFEASDPS